MNTLLADLPAAAAAMSMMPPRFDDRFGDAAIATPAAGGRPSDADRPAVTGWDWPPDAAAACALEGAWRFADDLVPVSRV